MSLLTVGPEINISAWPWLSLTALLVNNSEQFSDFLHYNLVPIRWQFPYVRASTIRQNFQSLYTIVIRIDFRAQSPYLMCFVKVACMSFPWCGLLWRIEEWDSPQVSKFTNQRSHRGSGNSGLFLQTKGICSACSLRK